MLRQPNSITLGNGMKVVLPDLPPQSREILAEMLSQVDEDLLQEKEQAQEILELKEELVNETEGKPGTYNCLALEINKLTKRIVSCRLYQVTPDKETIDEVYETARVLVDYTLRHWLPAPKAVQQAWRSSVELKSSDDAEAAFQASLVEQCIAQNLVGSDRGVPIYRFHLPGTAEAVLVRRSGNEPVRMLTASDLTNMNNRVVEKWRSARNKASKNDFLLWANEKAPGYPLALALLSQRGWKMLTKAYWKFKPGQSLRDLRRQVGEDFPGGLMSFAADEIKAAADARVSTRDLAHLDKIYVEHKSLGEGFKNSLETDPLTHTTKRQYSFVGMAFLDFMYDEALERARSGKSGTCRLLELSEDGQKTAMEAFVLSKNIRGQDRTYASALNRFGTWLKQRQSEEGSSTNR